jgi:hypothetical protein
MSAISDICYSDIGDKYVGLKNVIPISDIEEKDIHRSADSNPRPLDR